jgi:ABC-type transport system involved in multi-copper enzyme maturation permease subunit
MMSKPVAILKDSLREAWDSKTLLVMLILAGLFLVGVASIGYTQAEPKAVFENYAEQLSAPILRLDHGKRQVQMPGAMEGPPKALANYTLTSFRVVKEANHAPNGEYEFTLVVKPLDLKAEDEPKDPDKKDEPGKAGPKKAGPKKDEPKDGEREADGFETQVALWHEDGSGRFVKVEGRHEVDPKKVKVKIGAVTDDMVREFFATELERDTQVPIVGFERLPADNPGERVYKITTGPSAEPRVWPVKFSLGFGAYETESPAPLGLILYGIQDLVISSIGGMIIILIAVIVTAFFIPNMLRPGSVVMLLSKPISRTTLLLFKYLGGLFFVLILSTFVVGGVWLITGIRAGVWAPGIFVVVPLMTLTFAILYAVSTVAAVWTRNSIVAILITLAIAGTLWLVGKVEFFAMIHRAGRDAVAELKHEEPQYATWATVTGALNRALPRWHDIDVLTGEAVADSLMTIKQRETQRSAIQKHRPSWGGTIGVTGLWIVVLLGFACWRFSTKDY